MPPPLVAIVVLNWHGADDTISCIHSLSALEYPNWNLLVVDNGSSDDSVSRIARACPSAALLQSASNKGYSGGNNLGIRDALRRGAEYVWLLNNDVVVDARSLSEMVRVLESNPGIGAAGCLLFDMAAPCHLQSWGGARVTWTGRALRHKAPPPPGKLHYLVGASVLLRAVALQDIGCLDEGFFMYWDDADLGFRLRASGWKLVVAPSARVWHKEGGSSGRSSELDGYFSYSAVRFYRRHAALPAVPLSLNVAARTVKRALRGEWGRVAAVWTGTLGGMRSGCPSTPKSAAGRVNVTSS